jgi:hypothetical protein
MYILPSNWTGTDPSMWAVLIIEWAFGVRPSLFGAKKERPDPKEPVLSKRLVRTLIAW